MRYMKAPLHGVNGNIHLVEFEDFEFVDPFEKMAEIFINFGGWMEGNTHSVMHGEDSSSLADAIDRGRKQGYEDFVAHLAWAGRVVIPGELEKLFNIRKKSKQQELIKDLKLTTDILMSFIYHACKNHLCTYSFYSGKILPAGLNENDVPRMANIEDDGDISVYGKTKLTKPQIKALILQQKSVYAKFLDRESGDWYCFVYTMNGIAGREIEQEPHIHYLSSAWGMKRDQVVREIKAGRYPHTGNHIPYERYA